jgi:glutaredoxin-like protein DUF836
MTNPVEITLLTQDDCTFCDIAKEVLRRLDEVYPLRVTEISLATDQGQRLARSAGMLFAPGVLVDGAPFSYGRLSERKLRRALDKHLQEHPA